VKYKNGDNHLLFFSVYRSKIASIISFFKMLLYICNRNNNISLFHRVQIFIYQTVMRKSLFKLKLFFVILVIIMFSSGSLFSQGFDCNSADPFCTGTSYIFPASTNVADAGSVDCLLTTPNPAWYWMQVDNSGNIDITMSNTANVDIDFICWGPFSSLSVACAANLMNMSGVDCSYLMDATEYCNIPNAQSGDIYVLLITNFSNDPTNITFSQTGGTGSTNCGIIAPPVVGDNVCEGETIQLTVSNPTPGATYAWTGPGGWTSTQMNPTIPNASSGMAGTYSLVITVGGQTSPPVTCTVTVNSNPTITITPTNPTTCSGVATNLTGNSTTANTTYLWSTGSTTNPTSVSPVIPTNYTVTGTDGNGCSGTADVTVDISANLTISVSPPSASICLGSSIDLTASGATTYDWAPATGLSSTTGTTVTASPTTTTTYIVTGDANGCTGQTSVTVDLNGSLVIAVTPPNPAICIDGSIDLTASGALNYTWSPPDYLSSSTGAMVTASPPTTTTYTVLGVDANQCAGTTLVTVTLIPPPDMIFTPADPVVCKGESIDIGVDGGTSYIWSPPTGLSSTTGSLITAAPTATTTYTVLGENFGCTGTSSIEVVVSPIPIVDFSASTYEGCEDLVVTFYDQSVPPGAVWFWDFGDGSTPGAFTAVANPSHMYTEPGQYDITLSVTTVDGCQAQMEVSQMITVFKNPIASFYPNPQQTWIYESTINFFDESLNADIWSWDFGEAFVLDNYSNEQFPSHTYSDTGLFTITLAVMSPDGCVDTVQKTVYIEPNIAFYVPNSFTPNGDGKNDAFIVTGDGIDESTFIMRVYNRWGQQVYFSVDLSNGWDGKMDGYDKKSPEGTYCYIISLKDVKGKYHEYKGIINLIR
jgi:gliding motility-associated-like protein